ncbi:hypothetical protein E2320_004114, partial [Naja naja]
ALGGSYQYCDDRELLGSQFATYNYGIIQSSPLAVTSKGEKTTIPKRACKDMPPPELGNLIAGEDV